ncbi:MAG: gliding motility-associated C-terminal domain-containing protein [Fluviicola sp.]|nr:gliding motility-associated C-terminal domain-containing protein [Fluviicola sp.]
MIKKWSLAIVASILCIGSLFAFDENAAACPTIAMSGTNVTCNGGLNGSATVSISNGSGSYTINWSNTATSNTINGLSIGTYTVNVLDNVSGCTVVGAFVVGSPDPISVSGTATNVDCFGNNTGSVSIVVNGGTPAYDFDWRNAGNITVDSVQNLTGVPAGTYTVNITDAANCTFSSVFTITQPIEALNRSAIVTNADCFGSATGAINVDVWGGTTPYAYVWSSGQLTQDISGVTGGSYSLTITDANGCIRLYNDFISQPDVLAGAISSTPVLCYGDATGSVSFSPVGGTAPYSYIWQSATTLYSTTSNVLNNIPAGNYSLTVTDANGCQYMTSTTVAQPSELTGSTVATNVNCFGGTDGAINLTVSGGSVPYDYAWVNGVGASFGSSQDLANIVADNYTVTITDLNLCTLVINEVVTQPNSPVTASTVTTDVLCYGDLTGAIDLTVLGGSPPFTFVWSSFQTTEDISGVPANVYGYTVTDANGCFISGSATINQPLAPLSVTNIITPVNCFGESNGEIDLTVVGGTTPYAYEWANSLFLLSETGQDLINYPADTYNYSITDANGCNVKDTLDILEPTELQVTLVGTDILCKGGNNGAIDLTVSGGVTTYTYLWSNGSLVQDPILLIAGTYGVLVTDNNNCTITDTIILTEPMDSLRYTFSVLDVKCNDGTDGELDIDITGGTLPYNYAWSNGDTLATSQTLTAGFYTFLVTDNNGCIITDSLFVDQPDDVTLSEVITPVTCFGFSDGAIDISPTGGTVPYNFTWYNSTFALSAQTEDLVDFPADTYQLEIIDSNGCFYEMFLLVDQPEIINIDYVYNLVSCKDGSDGNIDVTVTGGNVGPIYAWSNGAATEDLTNVPSDIYQLVYTDSQGCQDSIEVDISEPDSVRIEFVVTEISCNDQFDGMAIAYPDGGNGGYTYLWSNFETSNVNTGLSNQWYSILVTDILGCTGSDSVYIPRNNSDCVFPVNTFTPNGDSYNDTWFIENLNLYPNMKMQVFNKWGNLIHKQEGEYYPWDGTFNGNQLPAETYYYILNLNQENRDPLKGNITIVR